MVTFGRWTEFDVVFTYKLTDAFLLQKRYDFMFSDNLES